MKVLSLAKLKEYSNSILIPKMRELFVGKENGKGLSTNDYTTAEKQKLQTLENPKVQTIKVNNVECKPDGTKAVNIDLSNYATKSEITNVYKYKGTKSTYAELPTTNNQVGDVWNIETADPAHEISAGDNVAWDGKKWDKLAGTVGGITSDIQAQLDKKVDKESGKGLSTNDYTTAEKTKLANLVQVEEITTEELQGIFTQA